MLNYQKQEFEKTVDIFVFILMFWPSTLFSFDFYS